MNNTAMRIDSILFEDKMTTLQATMQKQFVKGNELTSKILENFEKL